jgi:hypothetical protein
MALKAFDGFDHYKQLADMLSRSNFLQWQQSGSGSNPVVAFVTGLTGLGRALSLTTGESGGPGTFWSAIRSVFTDRNSEAYIGFRMLGKPSTEDYTTGLWIVVGDSIGGFQQFSVHFNESNYAIQIWTGNPALSFGTLLWTSSNNVWSGNVGEFIEMHIVINNTGTVEFRVNGVSVGTALVDTQQTPNAWFDVIDWLTSPINGFGNTIYLDDFYYCDTMSGPGVSPCNTFLGDVRVATVFATGNDAVQFTPLANTNWQEISEVAMDSDTSYNYDATAGHQDTFVFQPIANVITTIYGLQLTYAARKDDAGSRTIAGVIKISGTSYPYGSPDTVAASATYMYFSDLWILSPATGLNFTLSEINAADFGYKLVT